MRTGVLSVASDEPPGLPVIDRTGHEPPAVTAVAVPVQAIAIDDAIGEIVVSGMLVVIGALCFTGGVGGLLYVGSLLLGVDLQVF